MTVEEGDCDDTLASVNPYATDLVGDGVDQNCDGIDGTDGDGDGIASVQSGGTDCDDVTQKRLPIRMVMAFVIMMMLSRRCQ